jgi:uncharacterized membrane protein
MFPNLIPDPLHPAVVHLPIALVLMLPFVAIGALVAIRRGGRPVIAWGLTLAVLATLVASAWLATETGERQEERVEEIVGDAPMHAHEEAAEAFLLLAFGVLVISAPGLRRGGIGRLARIAGLAGSVALVGAGWTVGHSGGALVYQHGAAAAYAPEGDRSLSLERGPEEAE